MTLNNVVKSIVLANAPHELAYTAFLYVSPNGDNSDGSSWEKAYNTITSALTAASADPEDFTLIMVGSGIYTPAATITVNKAVEIRGVSPQTVIFKNPFEIVAPPFNVVFLLDHDGIILRNLGITDDGIAAFTIDVMGNGDNIIIDNCRFFATPATEGFDILLDDTGMGEPHTSNYTYIQNCEFIGSGTKIDNIYTGSNTTIRNCVFRNNGCAIKGTIAGVNTIIDGCLFVDCYSNIYDNDANTGQVSITNCVDSKQTDYSSACIYMNAAAVKLILNNNKFKSMMLQLPNPNSEVTCTTDMAAYAHGFSADILPQGPDNWIYRIKGIIGVNPSAPDQFFATIVITTTGGTNRTLATNIPIQSDGSITPIESDFWIYGEVGGCKATATVACVAGGGKTIDLAFLIERYQY